MEEWYEVEQCLVVDVPSPLWKDDAVVRMSLHGLWVCVDDDDLVEWPVDVRDILQEMQCTIHRVASLHNKHWCYMLHLVMLTPKRGRQNAMHNSP